jgi:methionyl-tRNA formyltransferase
MRDLEHLAAQDCDAIVVASYNQKIGDWTPYLRYAVNFHPSPLPLGRGPYPLIKAIRDRHTSWGVACHKLAPEFDAGDILASERFPLTAGECHDSLDLKIQMAAKRLAARVAAEFEALWNGAQPQVGGSYWNFWTEHDKTIDFREGVDDILRQSRAFGAHETFVDLKGFRLRVKRAIGWTEPHTYSPGTPVHAYNNVVVVAARDGFVALTEWVADGASPTAAQALNA